jgi:hypothetical protein
VSTLVTPATYRGRKSMPIGTQLHGVNAVVRGWYLDSGDALGKVDQSICGRVREGVDPHSDGCHLAGETRHARGP